MKINLKYYPQHKNYSCGPSCLRMVFEHLGKKYSEQQLIDLCHTNKRYGTSYEHLTNVIEHEKFVHYAKNRAHLQDLIDCVESGYLAIINYSEPVSNESHYAVVSGYTDDRKEIILADPCNGNDFTIPWNELKNRWHNGNNRSQRWFIVVKRESIEM